MKNIFTLFLAASALLFSAAKAPHFTKTENLATNEITEIKWENQTIDVGKIKHRVPKTVEFVVTNVGKAPLIIKNVLSTCGCTVPDFSKEPIMPGKKGTIKATYSAGSLGPFSKSVTVVANIEHGQTTLTIKGEVLAEEKK